jgi:TolB-like protein
VREAAASPDIVPRLSLVVLPFANLNSDPEQDYFADGVTTDLTTDLAQMPGAFVIGRGTAFTYKNKRIDLKTFGKELGIRWAVQGAVQRHGDQVRVNVSLTDLPTSRDVWSERFDGDRTKLMALQDQITARLARSLNIELIRAESHRSETERSQNPDAMDFSMRGWAKFYEPRSQIEIALWRTWPREKIFGSGTPRRRWLNTMPRLKSIQIFCLPTLTKDTHLSFPEGRTKPSSRLKWLSASAPKILGLPLGIISSAMHTCICANTKKPSRNAGARSI